MPEISGELLNYYTNYITPELLLVNAGITFFSFLLFSALSEKNKTSTRHLATKTSCKEIRFNRFFFSFKDLIVY